MKVYAEAVESVDSTKERGRAKDLDILKSDNVELNKLLKIRKVNNETPYSVVPLSSKPQILTCPHCQQYVTTEIAVRPSFRTHIKALCLATCCLCFVPYICTYCMNVDHFCPECETYIGTYIS